MSPGSIIGMKPSYRCKSEPQIAVEVIFTMASRGLRRIGSGTSRTRTSCVPYQQFAFMRVILKEIVEVLIWPPVVGVCRWGEAVPAHFGDGWIILMRLSSCRRLETAAELQTAHQIGER